ncbi:MAG: exopolysaccharide biosynthesis protein, partial [Rhodomicrobium sp.]
PRWVTPFETTQRVIGGFVLLLGLCLLIPVPLSNIPISLTIVLVAFAYLEEDGLLLAVALSITLGVLAVVAAALWSTVAGMIWLARG